VLPDRGVPGSARLTFENSTAIAHCADGGQLRLLAMALDGHDLDAKGLLQHLGPGPHSL